LLFVLHYWCHLCNHSSAFLVVVFDRASSIVCVCEVEVEMQLSSSFLIAYR
jgi:hypothetical protein